VASLSTLSTRFCNFYFCKGLDRSSLS
jgi:hypothetical protein